MSKQKTRLCRFDLCENKICNKGDLCTYCHLPKKDGKTDLNIIDEDLIKVIICTLIDLFNEHTAYQKEMFCKLDSKLCRYNICAMCKHDDECKYIHLPKTKNGDFNFIAIKDNVSLIQLIVDTAIELFTKLNNYSKPQYNQSLNNEYLIIDAIRNALNCKGKGKRNDWYSYWNSGQQNSKGCDSKGKCKYNSGCGNKGKEKGKGSYKGSRSDSHQDND